MRPECRPYRVYVRQYGRYTAHTGRIRPDRAVYRQCGRSTARTDVYRTVRVVYRTGAPTRCLERQGRGHSKITFGFEAVVCIISGQLARPTPPPEEEEKKKREKKKKKKKKKKNKNKNKQEIAWKK